MASSSLFSPITVGNLTLPNRIAMAPLTRCRAGEGNAPYDIHARYYAQRASAGLLISEATQIAPEGVGYPNTPGIHSAEQVKGWQAVTDAVHKQGGRIFLQLWHVGRVSHSSFQPNGKLPVAPSAIAIDGQVRNAHGVKVDYEVPHALTIAEIAETVAAYGRATRNARAAGFDGVEIHGANSYLIDQFMRPGSNTRSDQYGGSLENRMRFLTEVIEACVSAWDADHVGLRISPAETYRGTMSAGNAAETFGRAAEIANRFNLAYLHVNEGDNRVEILPILRAAFDGPLMVCTGYTKERAEAILATGLADIVAFGKLYISNPDLVERLASDAPLNDWDRSTFYGGGEAGYLDYPTLKDAQPA